MIKLHNSKGAVLSIKEIERLAIIEALQSMGGNLSKTAEVLGIGRGTLYRKMEKYGIEHPKKAKNS